MGKHRRVTIIPNWPITYIMIQNAAPALPMRSGTALPDASWAIPATTAPATSPPLRRWVNASWYRRLRAITLPKAQVDESPVASGGGGGGGFISARNSLGGGQGKFAFLNQPMYPKAFDGLMGRSVLGRGTANFAGESWGEWIVDGAAGEGSYDRLHAFFTEDIPEAVEEIVVIGQRIIGNIFNITSPNDRALVTSTRTTDAANDRRQTVRQRPVLPHDIHMASIKSFAKSTSSIIQASPKFLQGAAEGVGQLAYDTFVYDDSGPYPTGIGAIFPGLVKPIFSEPTSKAQTYGRIAGPIVTGAVIAKKISVRNAAPALAAERGVLGGLETRGIKPLPGTRIIPEGIPEGWRIRGTDTPGGVRYTNPRNRNEEIRIMQGDPNSPFPNSQAPYARQRNAAGIYLRQDGTPSPLPRGGLFDPDAHIPLNQFKVR
jgi:hypothetical protein